MTPAIMLAALALAANSAQEPAPTTPPPKSAPAPAEPAADVSAVTVSAAKPEIQTSLGRRSYSVANDLQAQTGSIADVLRNVPSVEVDLQGNLSLRGDSGVTVLIDGQPSSQFKGDNLATALQAMPASRVDRIEVITNPSAEFRADGTAGVINLITKKATGEGRTGSVQLNVRHDGTTGVSVAGGYNSNRLRLTADASYRYLLSDQYGVNRSTGIDPLTGAFVRTEDRADQLGVFDISTAHVGAEYELDARTRLSGDLRGSYNDRKTPLPDHLEKYDAAGTPIFIFDRQSVAGVTIAAVQATTSWRRRYGEGHDLALSANLDHVENRAGRLDATVISLPTGAPQLDTRITYDTFADQAGFKADYNRPLANNVKLKLGYALDIADSAAVNAGGQGTGGAPVAFDPLQSNRFELHDVRNQAYVSYERPFGKLTVLGGLRAETVNLELDQVTQAVETGQDYARLYPSLFLGYALGDGQRVTASYSRRINRPGLADFNPFQYSSLPQGADRGNPYLEPQDTDSFELGYERRDGASTLLATLYYRETTNAFTVVTTDLGDGVLLSERANAGQRRNGGLEVVKAGKLSPKLTYNLNANVYWTEIQASALGFAQDQSTTTAYGRANLNWQVTPKDFVQINVFANGKVVYPQGYAEPVYSGNIGYRHKVNDRVSWMIVAQDPFGTIKNELVFQTPAGEVRRVARGNTRQFGFSIVRNFGGAKPRDPNFDFVPGGVGG